MISKGWDVVDYYRRTSIGQIPAKDRKIICEKLGIPETGTLYYYDDKEWHEVYDWKIAQVFGESKMQVRLVITIDTGKKLEIQAMRLSLMQQHARNLPSSFKKRKIERANCLLYKAIDVVCNAHNQSCCSCPYQQYNQDTDTMECILEEIRSIALEDAKNRGAW